MARITTRPVWDRWADGWSYDPLWNYEHYLEALDDLKAQLGRLIGADPSSIAICENVSHASNIAVRLVARRPGGNVVVDETTYPSSLYPWMTMSGYAVRNAAATSEPDGTAPLASVVDHDTAVISITHVSDLTGRRHDLAACGELARSHDALLMVDAAQSAGAIEIDVRRDGVDILTGTVMKWLFGPPGLGFLYIRPDLLEESPLLDVGYEAITVMVAGQPDKLDAMTDLLTPFGIVELQRTGRIALPKLSRQPSKLRVVKNRTA